MAGLATWPTDGGSHQDEGATDHSLHVGIFTNTYLPTVNGVVNSIEAFRRGLEALGHDVYVFAPRVPGQDDHEPHAIRYPAIPAPARVQYPLALPLSPTVSRALARLPLDLIHTQHPWWVGSWGAHYAQRRGLPLVTTIHTQYEQYLHYVMLPRVLLRPLIHRQVVRYCNGCDVVATPGESMQGWLRAQGVLRPVEVLPNATDLAPFAAADGEPVRRRFGIAPGEVLLLSAGRIAPEKSLDVLVRGFALVAGDGLPAKLLLVGDGPALGSLQALAGELGVTERVIFAGRVPYPEMPPYQAAADLFVMTSLTEVQPLVLTEAMAAGAVVVAVRAPGPQDMVREGETGLLSPAGAGAEGFAKVLRRAVADRSLREGLAAAARRDAERYDIPQATQRLLTIYELAQERCAALRGSRVTP